jgi:hypothetical protein
VSEKPSITVKRPNGDKTDEKKKKKLPGKKLSQKAFRERFERNVANANRVTRLAEFSPIWRFFTFSRFLKIAEVAK